MWDGDDGRLGDVRVLYKGRLDLKDADRTPTERGVRNSQHGTRGVCLFVGVLGSVAGEPFCTSKHMGAHNSENRTHENTDFRALDTREHALQNSGQTGANISRNTVVSLDSYDIHSVRPTMWGTDIPRTTLGPGGDLT